jgi:uncharacterized protein YukE
MANIKVDHNELEKTVSSIDAYIKNHNNKMKNIDDMVTSLGTSWQGTDYDQLKTECQQMSASGSTSDQMLKSLDNYADFLRFAANKYKSAQANAINRANQLPRY